MRSTRRNFLRGLGGATLTLPWMESLSLATPAKGVAQRMAHFYVPIGVVRRGFFPGEGDTVIPKGNLGNVMASLGKQNPNFEAKPLEALTPTMEPLGDLKRKVNLITGMDRTFQDGTDVHAQCACCYLSSAEPYSIERSAWPLDRTLDHLLVDALDMCRGQQCGTQTQDDASCRFSGQQDDFGIYRIPSCSRQITG